LTAELNNALLNEKASRSAADQALAEKKAARQATEQSLLNFNEAKALLAREQDSTGTSLTTTTDKLSSKSSALDHAVIREQQMKIQLTACKEKLTVVKDNLKAVEEDMKT
jgi:hypothetical protein